jgi:DNA-binding Lrp family transcriptional regulator
MPRLGTGTLLESCGVSQPTVTRRRKKLENAGIVKEYTVIPDFREVGYRIMAITLFKYSLDVVGDRKSR